MSVINCIIFIVLLACVLCYIVAESYKNDHILEQTFKTIEHRLDEERSKQFDDFKRTTKKQTAIFRHTIANNQKTFAEKTNTIAELKRQLENAFTRITELESKQVTQTHRDFNNESEMKEAGEDLNYMDEVDNTTSTVVKVHAETVFCLQPNIHACMYKYITKHKQ